MMKLRSHLAFITLACMTLGVGAGPVAAVGCTPGQKQAINTGLDVLQFGCIIANADLADEKAVATACQLADTFLPSIKQAVTDYKAKRAAYAASKMSAAHCTEK